MAKEKEEPQSGRKRIGVSVSKRVYSLDALRGLDMMMIMGVDSFFHELSEANPAPLWETLSIQFDHPAWNGFHLYDLIFPLFLFIAGVATPYSVAGRLRKGKTKTQVFWHVVKRGLTLVLLGIIYNNGLRFLPLEEIRFPSVLGRIGLAYMFANIIFLYTKKTEQIIWTVCLLIGYWLLLKLGSAPGFPMGDLTREGNLVSFLDRSIIPGHLYEGIHDPEGLFGTLPAIATGLLGILTGRYIKESMHSPSRKAAWMAAAGILSLALAQLWNLNFPINKNLWTSSFVLQTAGFSLLLLALFYYIIDVCGYKKWAFFLKVIGMNSILIYMSSRFIDWEFSAHRLFAWAGQLAGARYEGVMLAFCAILVQWLFLYICYKKKIFLKV